MRRVILGVALAACVAAGTASAQQDRPGEFSATLVLREPSAKEPPLSMKYYVSEDRVRMELSMLDTELVTLRDLGTGKTTVLMPREQLFSEMPASALSPLDQRALSAFQSTRQGESPCDLKPEFTCERLGTERVNGRSTQKWRMVPPKDSSHSKDGVLLEWIAPELGPAFPVRLELADGSVMEFIDIKVGPQPDSLFEVPAGYQRVDAPPQ